MILLKMKSIAVRVDKGVLTVSYNLSTVSLQTTLLFYIISDNDILFLHRFLKPSVQRIIILDLILR